MSTVAPANTPPAVSAATESPDQQRTVSRLVSLDVYRGLTVAAMILVTDPGAYNARYAQLSHAE